MKAGRLTTVGALAYILIAAPALYGQAHRAIILGQVTDRSGALIPGAAVKAIQTETNLAAATATNQAGHYEFPGLLPGTYKVEATSQGFKTATVEGIVLTSAKRAQIDLMLEIGELAETVVVRSERALLDTASADTNAVVDQRKVMDLPVGQGNVVYLYFMAPGAMSATAVGLAGSVGNDVMLMQRGGSAVTRFNGSPAGTTEYTIDGAPNTQRGNAAVGGGVAFNPTPDMVQEVRVQTATFDASVGHTGGATVDVVLRSGTNELHGSVHKFFRGRDWNANSWSGNLGGTPRIDYEYQNWGFTGGGPVRIPKLYDGRNRTFFFGGFEDWAGLSPDLPDFVTIPTPQQLRGDFSALLGVGPQYQLYDADSARLLPNGRVERSPFPGNIIPTSRIHPVASAFAKLWPEPNAPGTADGQRNFTHMHEPYPRKLWSLPLRFDHELTPAQKLFARVVLSKTQLPRSTYFTKWEFPVWTVDSDHRELAVGDVWTFGPGLVGDFRASVMRFSWDTVPIAAGLDYKDYGLSSVTGLFDTKLAGLPSVSVAGYASPTNPQGSRQLSEIRVAAAHFSRIVGAHTMRFGADLRWYIDNRGRNDMLSIAFSGGYSRGPLDTSPAAPIGAGLADFLTGRFGSANLNQPSQAANLSTYQGLYFQDDWKLTRKLTLNLGIRYEREGPATERFNRNIAGFDFAVDNPIAAQAIANYARDPMPGLPASQFRVPGGLLFAGVGGNPRTIYDSNGRNFAPRVGLAYQVGPSTVVRAGYGMYFIPYGQRFIANEGGVPGFDTNTLSLSTQDGVTFTRTLDNLFPTGLTPPAGSSLGLKTYLGQSVSFPSPRRNPNAYNQRWQFSIQQRFLRSYRVEARYVGNHTVRMPIARNFNALPNAYLSTSPERDQARIDFLSTRVSNPFYGIPDVGGTLGSATVVSYSTLLKPFPAFGNITTLGPQGAGWYQSLQLEIEKQITSGLTFQSSYSFSKTLDALTYLNAADGGPEKVIADIDRPHIWRLLGIYELPLGKGRRWGGSWPAAVNYLLGGWQIQTISMAQSGAPLPFDNILFRGNIKDIPVATQTPGRLFNIDAGFERSAARQLSDNVRTFPSRLAGVRYPAQINTDFSVLKNTRIREKFEVQFRGEAYNVFNQHYFYTGAVTAPASSTFGSTTGTSGPRTLQLGLKLIY